DVLSQTLRFTFPTTHTDYAPHQWQPDPEPCLHGVPHLTEHDEYGTEHPHECEIPPPRHSEQQQSDRNHLRRVGASDQRCSPQGSRTPGLLPVEAHIGLSG